MSIQTPLDIYSNTLIKNLEHIQNKALVIAPFEITKSGKLDPDLLLDTPGIININLYKKIVAGEDKEPTANQFKTIKYISELDSSNRISTFNIPVIFKYDKETGIRTIEKDLTLLLNDPDYMDLIIDIQNVDLSSETGSNGFYCVCQVQKILKPAATTTFTEVAKDEFLFMIPSVECNEIPEADEFDLLDTDNKVINIKKIEALGIPDILFEGNLKLTQNKDFFNDGSNVATYLFNDNLEEENTNYTPESNRIGYNDGQFGKAVTFSGRDAWVTGQLPDNMVGVSLWFKLSGTTNGILPTLFSANKNNEIFRIFPDPARGQIHIRNASTGSGTYMVRVTKDIETNRWYHIYMDNSMNGLYIDGVYYPVTGSSGFSYNWVSPINTFELNNRYNNTNNYISGYVEQFRIFSRALLSDEILDLYLNSPKSLIFNSDRDITEIAIDASIKLDDLDDLDNLTVFDLDNETNYTPITSEEILYSDPDFFNDGSNIASYFFNDNLNDASGKFNGVSSTNANFSYEIGKFGKSIKTNSSTSSVNLGIPQGTSTLLVVSFWLKWNGVNAIPITLGTSGSGAGQCFYFLNNYVGINSHNGDLTGFSSNGLSGVWKHFVVEFNTGKVGRIWIDGIEQKLNSIYGSFSASKAVTSNLPIIIGFDGYGNFGEMDQVRLFNRSLLQGEIYSLMKETKQRKYMVNLNTPTKNLKITTGLSATYIKAKVLTFPDLTKQGYRIHPVIKIPETPTTPKYYLGSKYQRNIMDVLAPALKSKRTISNLKDMYLVDDLCIQTLKKINILLKNNQMIKFSERLYNLATPLTPLREKLNAELILEYLSTPVSGSYSNDLEVTLKTSLIEDYNFTQEEIDNLNDNLNMFKSRARIALATPTIDNDKFRFDLPNTFIDGNKSKTEKKNLLVFGTDAGFNKFNLAGYSTPYSNISKRDTSEVLNIDDLTLGLSTLSSLEDISTIKDFQMSYGDETQHILFENGNLYASRYVSSSNSYKYNRDGLGFTAQHFPLKLINTDVKSLYCGTYATFIIDNNSDVWALGGYSGTNPDYDIYGINSSGNYLPNWTKVFNSTPENTPKKVIGLYSTTWLLMESGELFCTGYIPNYFTFDGIGKNNTKTWISLSTGVADVDCSDSHVCYTLTNGEVYVGNYNNTNGVTTQSGNGTTANTKVLKILTNWIPINQTIIQIECTYENNYYLLSNGDVYGVGRTRAGQLGYVSTGTYGVPTPIKLYTGVKRIIPQLFGRNQSCSVSMVELITGEIKCMGNTNDYKFGYFEGSGATTPITLYPKVDKIFLTERNVLAIIDGKIFNSGWNRFSGTNLINQTITEQFLDIAVSKNFRDILSNYKQQIPFTYIPLSTDIDDINIKPVFDNLTDITGFYKNNEIIIDIPNTL